MDLDLGPEIEQFRAEMRDWIAAQAPPALAGLTDWTMAAIPGPPSRPAHPSRPPPCHPRYVSDLRLRRPAATQPAACANQVVPAGLTT